MTQGSRPPHSLGSLAAQVPPSGIREIVNLVVNRPAGSVLRLEVGEPNFPTPAHIVDAASAAAHQWTGYTQSSGTLALREEIATALHRRAGLTYSPNELCVSQGGGQGLSALCGALLDPGDEVLVPDPGWPNYEMLALLRGAVPVRYSLRPRDGFVPDPAEIESFCTPRTRMIVLNSPSNPTGAVFPGPVVEAIVQMAQRRGIWLVSDEVYDELIYDGAPANAGSYDPDRETVIGLYSFSKTYAMTGWRVGYVASNARVTQLLQTIQEPLLSCISSVSQDAALAALRGPQDAVDAMRDAYRSRRDLLVGALTNAGFEVLRPDGAFYLMLALAPGVDSRLAALDLLEHHAVAVAPGSAFGDVASDHFRLSLASSEETLLEAAARITAWSDRTGRGAAL